MWRYWHPDCFKIAACVSLSKRPKASDFSTRTVRKIDAVGVVQSARKRVVTDLMDNSGDKLMEMVLMNIGVSKLTSERREYFHAH